MTERTSSDHPLGSGCIDGDSDHHVWQPCSFRFETQLLDDRGRVLARQPDLDAGRVYFICMKCRGFSFADFSYVGFQLGDTDYVLRKHSEDTNP